MYLFFARGKAVFVDLVKIPKPTDSIRNSCLHFYGSSIDFPLEISHLYYPLGLVLIIFELCNLHRRGHLANILDSLVPPHYSHNYAHDNLSVCST